ncbi:hypothetical protein AB0I53_20005 [Saccharopolyspora sp. NPDC050389]|uniref:hypothetical protein n=1 Tax=Saccharopolyspora sp. NPDC050389 TaxID=3155516 RepID=UPI0034022D89
MNEMQVDAAAQLARADRLGAEARRGGRWYVRYLVVFGIASFAMAAAFAFVDSSTAVIVTMPLWIAFVVGISVWSATRKVGLRGFGSLHGMVMLAWTLAWITTVVVGGNWMPDVWQWWLGGGIAMAAIAFVGAGVAHRRSRG